MKPNLFISGASGSGKSSSLRNLDPDKVVIINTERKQLPFRGANKFKQAQCSNYQEFLKLLERAEKSPAEIIVIDSFTSLSEQIQAYAKATWRGFDVWSGYADLIYQIIQRTKMIDKYVVFIGIDEPLQDGNGEITKHVRVEGKALKGSIEKEFTCVLWAKVRNENGAIQHNFETNNDGTTTAKTPLEMFTSQYIDNDLNYVIEQIKEYYA